MSFTTSTPSMPPSLPLLVRLSGLMASSMAQALHDRDVATLIDLDMPGSWPTDLRSRLCKSHDVFLTWETRSSTVTASDYHDSIAGLEATLRKYALVGWHCTRLTEGEIASIQLEGLQLPNLSMLHRRLDALGAAGVLAQHLVAKLKTLSQAHESEREGRLWFCFYQPRLAGADRVERFFRHWGGEALYNSHEDDPETGPAIAGIGSPCVVEAIVPVAALRPHSWLSINVSRRYLISRGCMTAEPVYHDDAIVSALPRENVRRIVVFPSAEFAGLTGGDEWRPAIER